MSSKSKSVQKKAQMRKLVEEMKCDPSMEKIIAKRQGKSKNVGLINQFKYHEIIPNKWFDWERRLNAPIMIIGQDWGPYTALKKFVDLYEKDKYLNDFHYDKFLFKTFSSRTEKFILSTIEQTYQEYFKLPFDLRIWDNIFFTMAVLFTRKGKRFRGSDNFDEKKSADHSSQYLKRQIDIVQPKLIIPLGNLALKSVNRYFNVDLKNKSITQIVEDLSPAGTIDTQDTTVFPNFHPAAHISPKIQKSIWSKMWEIVGSDLKRE